MAIRLWNRSYLGKRYFHSTLLQSSEKVIFFDEKMLQSLNMENDDIEVTLQELPISNQEFTRGSKEADFGRKRIGSVDLPTPLIKSITQYIDQQPDKRLIRTDALRLYESLRSTSRLQSDDYDKTKINNNKKVNSKKKKNIATTTTQPEPHILSYGPRESAAYVAGVLPSTYAAISNIFLEIKNRLMDFSPISMLDFGTGPGTSIWAAKNTFDTINKVTGVDLSEDMLRVAEYIENDMQTKKDIDFKRYMTYDPRVPKTDLVVSAFTLGEITSLALQQSTVKDLWDQTGDVLVLVERGTPVGFSTIARARQWILDYEKEDIHVVAPCPHDKPCPLMYSSQANVEKFWCHFSQRVQRPPFLMKTKHSKYNTEDSKYSYVIFRRKPRPSTESIDAASSSIEEKAYTWPRLIQPPLKKNKHVVMDVCSTSGTIQRMVIPKSQGKVEYRDARKITWGDQYPWKSKNKIVTRVSEGVVDSDDSN
ncbi:mitochondrial small ribosomal subunit Rsm22-domain-containing protein [Cunninghamella echinulata]|nr:mitochondrial small ribosomal subunit Rsm22-domain-containing protein [Cunninghamella echinulata]